MGGLPLSAFVLKGLPSSNHGSMDGLAVIYGSSMLLMGFMISWYILGLLSLRRQPYKWLMWSKRISYQSRCIILMGLHGGGRSCLRLSPTSFAFQ